MPCIIITIMPPTYAPLFQQCKPLVVRNQSMATEVQRKKLPRAVGEENVMPRTSRMARKKAQEKIMQHMKDGEKPLCALLWLYIPSFASGRQYSA